MKMKVKEVVAGNSGERPFLGMKLDSLVLNGATSAVYCPVSWLKMLMTVDWTCSNAPLLNNWQLKNKHDNKQYEGQGRMKWLWKHSVPPPPVGGARVAS